MTRRYLLDSGPARDFLFQRHGVEERATAVRKSGAKIGICTPVLGEIAGLRIENWRANPTKT